MKFLLFWLGEFAEIALLSILIVVVFFGGWSIPGYGLICGTIASTLGSIEPLSFLASAFSEGQWGWALIGHMILIGKVLAFIVLQIVIRWTLPRFRYDQLMTLGWKILLPLSIINLMITAVIVLM